MATSVQFSSRPFIDSSLTLGRKHVTAYNVSRKILFPTVSSVCKVPLSSKPYVPAIQDGNLRRSLRTSCSEGDDFDVVDIDQFDSDDLDLDEDEDDESTDSGLDIVAHSDHHDEPMDDPLEGVYVNSGSEIENGWSVVENVEYTIDEEQFHKIELHNSSFFIKIAPDRDFNVYDFTEVYVATNGSNSYAIPKIKGELPQKPVRCMKGEWKVLWTDELPLTNEPRQPVATVLDFVTKVFLIKHHLNRRETHEDFALNFEEIYVLDDTDRSIQRAEVKVEVPGGKFRERKDEVLVVRDNGTSFHVIHERERRTADDIIDDFEWNKTKEELEDHLRGYRDFERSNWF